ncbi:MAG: glutathionylspermidine synthase family protein [Flavobacterium sp.]
MERKEILPRNNWKKEVEKIGFGFHTSDIPYWDESAYYQLDINEIIALENATSELWQMSLEAVEYVIEKNLFHLFHIPNWFISHIKNSWEQDSPSIYGRFDLAYKNGEIKLLEFNADTPTSLFEASIVQWYWLQDFDNSKDQFNSIHEKLINYWGYLKNYLNKGKLHFTCVKQSLEDLTTIEYLRDCAIQANLDTKLVFIDDIGYDYNNQFFVDLEDQQITNIFKLYPFEWLVNEEFGKIINQDKKTNWIEPSWKMILSNKAILPILWQIYPNHKYLLKSYFEKKDLINFAKKPILSREGANISLINNHTLIANTTGEYGREGFIFQDLFELPNFKGNYPLIGSWIIGQEPAGIGIRESNTLITDNKSKFIPHLIS